MLKRNTAGSVGIKPAETFVDEALKGNYSN